MTSFFNWLRDLFARLFGKRRPRPEPQPPIADAQEVPADTVVVVVNEEEVIAADTSADTSTDHPPLGPDIGPDDVRPPDEPSAPAPHQPRYMWCLDNGHGKLTQGKRSPLFDDGHTRLYEYEFNRDVVRRIAARLHELGVQYYEVMPEVDEVGNALEERVRRANELQSDLPKIFVSVHCNAAPAPSPEDWCDPAISGIETWFYHTSTKGKKLAAIFQRHLVAATGWKNRHIKSQPTRQFYVLKKTTMPAILTENGFYNNKAQAVELMQDEVRQKIAEAHVQAILEVERQGL